MPNKVTNNAPAAWGKAAPVVNGVSNQLEYLMASYRYKPYYRYDGPTHSDPLREELSADEIKRRLALFREELPHYFSDLDADIEVISKDGDEQEYVVSVTVEATQSESDERVKRCLNNLDLFANKL